MIRDVKVRKVAVIVGVATISMAVSGCISSPRYGTEKTANAHLVDGLSSLVALGGRNKNAQVAYTPRPALVDPPKDAALPVPQQSVASKENPQWLESPEETRQRLVDEASNDTNPGINSSPLASKATSAEQLEKFREARAIQKGAYSGRRYLSDPPVAYKQPADTAPVDDLGESEFKKEQRRKEAARKSKRGFKIWPF
jgi:hypothetical protein